jgi:hypothetical protein
MLIIFSLAIGWFNAVTIQQANTVHVTGLYNHLVEECNTIIHANEYKDFCVRYPDGTEVCQQNDLNGLLPFINQT